MKGIVRKIFAAIMVVAMVVTVVQVQPMEAQAASKKLTYGIYKKNTDYVNIRIQIGIDKYSKKLVMNYALNYKYSDMLGAYEEDPTIETTFHLKKIKKGVYKAKEYKGKGNFIKVFAKGKKIRIKQYTNGFGNITETLKLKKKKKYTVVAG